MSPEPTPSDIRTRLESVARGARSVFRRGDPAFVSVTPTSDDPDVVVLAENHFLPTQAQVEHSRRFAYSAVVASHRKRAARESSFEGDAGVTVTELGYFSLGELERPFRGSDFRSLVNRAADQLSRRCRVALVRACRDALGSDKQQRVVATGAERSVGDKGRRAQRLVLQLGEFDEHALRPFGDLVAAGLADVAIGFDNTSSDLTDSILYEPLEFALHERGRDAEDTRFVIQSDVHVTRALQLHERTGLFDRWHADVGDPRDVGWEAGSCYFRVDAALPAVRLDVIARPNELAAAASRAAAWFAGQVTLFGEENSRVAESSKDRLVFVPSAFSEVLTELSGRRSTLNPLQKYYAAFGPPV